MSEPIYPHYLCYTEKDQDKGWEIISGMWIVEYFYDKWYDILDIVDYWGLESILYSDNTE